MGDRSALRPRPAPTCVRAAVTLLAGTPVLGVILTSYATWALNTVPAGVGALVDSLGRHDRALLKNSWVLRADQPVAPVDHLPLLIWLGLGYLVFLPLAYYLARGAPVARAVTYLCAAVLVIATATAVVVDEDFADPDPGRLSADAFAAWQALFPPGYAGVHLFAMIALVAAVLLACALLDRPTARAYFSRVDRRDNFRRATYRK